MAKIEAARELNDEQRVRPVDYLAAGQRGVDSVGAEGIRVGLPVNGGHYPGLGIKGNVE